MTQLMHHLAIRPDIRDVPFSTLVERLVQWHPMAFGVLAPHDPKVALFRLQSGLRVQPSFCGEMYAALAASYGLSSTKLSCWWIQKNDVSLGELHERLWHEANMTKAFYRKPYRP